MAFTPKQARQFIVHEHITIGERKITSPSYIVSVGEESMVKYAITLNFTNSNITVCLYTVLYIND